MSLWVIQPVSNIEGHPSMSISLTCAMNEAKTMTPLHLPSGCSPSKDDEDVEVDDDVEKLLESNSKASSTLALM